MRKRLIPLALAIAICVASAGCAKQVSAPVPGSLDSFDAYAFRTVSDAQAALTPIKVWRACSVAGFPATVTVDGNVQVCDSKSGIFPDKYLPYLNKAIQSYNTAQSLGLAYHSGKSQDAQGLAQALTQLGVDISSLLTQTGGGK